MKKQSARLAAGATLVVALAALTGCSASASGGGSSSVTLNILDEFTTAPASPKLNELIKTYESANPGVKIVRTSVPQGQGVTKLTQGVSTGNAPDVVFFDSPNTQQYAAQGLVENLNSKVAGWATKSEYYKGAWDSTQYSGGTYGVPLYSDAPGIYVNQDMLTAAGISKVPSTWTELRTDAKALTKNGVSGLCFGTTPGAAADYLFMPYIWQSGGSLNTVATSALPSLQLFQALKADGSIPQDVLNWTWQDAFTAFQNKSCGIVFGGPWNAGDAAKLPFKVAAGIPPQKDGGTKASVLGGYNVGTGKGGNVDAAWKFIDWFTSKKVLASYLEATTQLPNRKDLADLSFVKSSPFLPTFVKSISIGKPRTFGAQLPQIDSAIMSMFQSVLAGKLSPTEAAKQGESAIGPLLSK
ncbi:MAG: transporter, solute-binding protein [Microbacteriaceae bacterium]|nr:transporter, solute-binding protein [Microbacteriaceae bacterium]